LSPTGHNLLSINLAPANCLFWQQALVAGGGIACHRIFLTMFLVLIPLVLLSVGWFAHDTLDFETDIYRL